MKILVKRTYKKTNYTIGNLYINDQWFCNTMEDVDKGLTQSQPSSYIYNVKRCGDVAIPAGTYNIDMDTVSPKYSKREKYKSIDGKLPRLEDVPGFEGILIHCGNTHEDSKGCILVGKNKLKGRVCKSTTTFFNLYKILQDAKNKGEEITITIE